MRKAKPPSDQVTPRKHDFDLFGRRIGGDVKILWHFSEQQITYTTTHDKCLVTGILQAANHLRGVRTKPLHRKTVACGRNKRRVVDNKFLEWLKNKAL